MKAYENTNPIVVTNNPASLCPFVFTSSDAPILAAVGNNKVVGVVKTRNFGELDGKIFLEIFS